MSRDVLDTIKSLPPGFDPIFSSGKMIEADSGVIQIKPMRLSKGFENFEADSAN